MGQPHPPSLSVVIPCYNEESAIPRVLPRLERTLNSLKTSGQVQSAQVLIVDDFSSDLTSALLKNYPWVESIRLPQRSGYGNALKTGFRQASGDLIAFFDLDGTYDPGDLCEMIATLQRVPAEVVSGERFTRDAGMPKVRKVGNLFFSALIRFLSGQSTQDVCSGFRVFRRRWLPELCALSKNDLSFSLRMTLWALHEEIPMLEIPIGYDRRDGVSKLRVLTHGPVFLWTILAFFATKRGKMIQPNAEKTTSARINQSAT